MKGFKGFDKDMKCRDKQYEVGQMFEEAEANLCNKGLHFCEHPADCFTYYPPGKSRFAEIEAEDVSEETHDEDSKRVAKKITVKAELSILGIVKAILNFSSEKSTPSAGSRAHATSAGDDAHATSAGSRAHATSAGDDAHAHVKGKNSIAVSLGIEGKAAGALGCWISLAEWKKNKNGEWVITCVKSTKVDGNRIKADTFYILKDRKFVEVQT